MLAAAAAGQGDAMQALLDGGALVDASSSTGETAMMAAASHGHVHCMEVLQAFSAGRHSSFHSWLQVWDSLIAVPGPTMGCNESCHMCYKLLRYQSGPLPCLRGMMSVGY